MLISICGQIVCAKPRRSLTLKRRVQKWPSPYGKDKENRSHRRGARGPTHPRHHLEGTFFVSRVQLILLISPSMAIGWGYSKGKKKARSCGLGLGIRASALMMSVDADGQVVAECIADRVAECLALHLALQVVVHPVVDLVVEDVVELVAQVVVHPALDG